MTAVDAASGKAIVSIEEADAIEAEKVLVAVGRRAACDAETIKSLGLEMDASGFGMGERSQRFALIADDGVVSHLFIEAPGEYRVSAAEHVLLSL